MPDVAALMELLKVYGVPGVLLVVLVRFTRGLLTDQLADHKAERDYYRGKVDKKDAALTAKDAECKAERAEERAAFLAALDRVTARIDRAEGGK